MRVKLKVLITNASTLFISLAHLIDAVRSNHIQATGIQSPQAPKALHDDALMWRQSFRWYLRPCAAMKTSPLSLLAKSESAKGSFEEEEDGGLT